MIKNKKGVSAIIASVLLIAIVLVIGGIVWGVVTNLVSNQLEESGNCLEAFNKLEINNQYTCYNASSQELLVSVSVKDIDLNEMLISVSGSGVGNSYTITPSGASGGNIDSWPVAGNPIIPERDSIRTYIISGDFQTKPDSISLIPIVKGTQCDKSDTLSQIDSCSLLA